MDAEIKRIEQELANIEQMLAMQEQMRQRRKRLQAELAALSGSGCYCARSLNGAWARRGAGWRG